MLIVVYIFLGIIIYLALTFLIGSRLCKLNSSSDVPPKDSKIVRMLPRFIQQSKRSSVWDLVSQLVPALLRPTLDSCKSLWVCKTPQTPHLHVCIRHENLSNCSRVTNLELINSLQKRNNRVQICTYSIFFNKPASTTYLAFH